MFPTTPTLPTVIITPSTPLYLLPSRQSYVHKPFPFSPSASPSSGPSSSRQYTRKQHLVSALALDLDTSEKQAGGMDHSLLLPPPLHLGPPPSKRRPTGILLSLLILALFSLILVGPALPYKWWTAASPVGEVPEVEAPDLTQAGAGAMVALSEADSDSLIRRWEAYGPGQGGNPRYTQAFGPGQEQMPAGQEEQRSRATGTDEDQLD